MFFLNNFIFLVCSSKKIPCFSFCVLFYLSFFLCKFRDFAESFSIRNCWFLRGVFFVGCDEFVFPIFEEFCDGFEMLGNFREWWLLVFKFFDNGGAWSLKFIEKIKNGGAWSLKFKEKYQKMVAPVLEIYRENQKMEAPGPWNL